MTTLDNAFVEKSTAVKSSKSLNDHFWCIFEGKWMRNHEKPPKLAPRQFDSLPSLAPRSAGPTRVWVTSPAGRRRLFEADALGGSSGSSSGSYAGNHAQRDIYII